MSLEDYAHLGEAAILVISIITGVFFLVRKMLNGFVDRVEYEVDKKTEPLRPNGGSSVGDLPAVVRQHIEDNRKQHSEIQDSIVDMCNNGIRDRRELYDHVRSQQERTDAKLDKIDDRNRSLLEKFVREHGPWKKENDE